MTTGEGEGEGEAKWRYTWEAQMHMPTLRLLLFAEHEHGDVNPCSQCLHLTVQLQHSVLAISWQGQRQGQGQGHGLKGLRVPIPTGLLLDSQTPPSVQAFPDHIQVKFLLLLPLHHPLLSLLPIPLPPSASSDVHNLSSTAPLHFYCTTCSFQLTTNPLRRFVEMPSVNWREVADNWFGACCCSFGGISEKLVVKYANSYTCAPGVCLLSSTSITISTHDLIQYHFPQPAAQHSDSKSDVSDQINKPAINSDMSMQTSSTPNHIGRTRFVDSENENLHVNSGHVKSDSNDFSQSYPDSNVPADMAMAPSCAPMTNSNRILENGDGQHQCCENARKENMDTPAMEILASQKSFLNGFLEDVFMARPSNLSKDIDWCEFTCPQCQSVLGAYPCCKGDVPVDGGVRLFKCNISTCLPARGSADLFKQYSLEKMFANKLIECANDESSFRFLVIDLKEKSPALQITLINPDTWSISGDCFITADSEVPKLQLQPVIKVLFSECSTDKELQLRRTEEWVTNNSAESIFMLTCQIKELVASLMSARDAYPPSYASLQGSWLSSLQR